MPLSIAASGKGGVGKTTFCALLVRYMIEVGKSPILAVDADPNSNLGALLGMEPEGKIADLREDANQPANTPSGVPKARMIETWLNQIVQEGKGFDLLTMGRPEGPRCYCYVNDLLRQFLSRLKKSYPLVIIDNEAGMEHLSRLTTDNIDRLLIVSEPTVPSVRTVGRILELAASLPIKVGRQAMLLNKAKNGSIPESVRQQAENLEVSATLKLSYSQTLGQLYERGGSVFDLPGKLQDDPELTKIAQWCLSG
ncbi:MAG: AAA family ATPase [Actinobacteria bacterium]|nr:AAA family ATPase [Actinomycetota bacterium]